MATSLTNNTLTLGTRQYTDGMFAGSIITGGSSGSLGAVRGVAYYDGTRSINFSSGTWIGMYCTAVVNSSAFNQYSGYTSSTGSSFSVIGDNLSDTSPAKIGGGNLLPSVLSPELRRVA